MKNVYGQEIRDWVSGLAYGACEGSSAIRVMEGAQERMGGFILFDFFFDEEWVVIEIFFIFFILFYNSGDWDFGMGLVWKWLFKGEIPGSHTLHNTEALMVGCHWEQARGYWSLSFIWGFLAKEMCVVESFTEVIYCTWSNWEKEDRVMWRASTMGWLWMITVRSYCQEGVAQSQFGIFLDPAIVCVATWKDFDYWALDVSGGGEWLIRVIYANWVGSWPSFYLFLIGFIGYMGALFALFGITWFFWDQWRWCLEAFMASSSEEIEKWVENLLLVLILYFQMRGTTDLWEVLNFRKQA